MRLCDLHYRMLEKRVTAAGLSDFMHMSRLQIEALCDAAFEQVIADAPKPATFEPILVGHIALLKHLMDNAGTKVAMDNSTCPVCHCVAYSNTNLLDGAMDTVISVSQSMLKTQ